MKNIFLFTDVAELVTLESVRNQDGRRIREKDLSILKNAAFVVRDGKIVWVGSSKKVPKDFTKLRPQKISLGKQIVLPGLVDCHTHMVFAGDRAFEFEMRNQGATYQDIAKAGGGIISTVKETRRTSHERLLKLSQVRVNEHIRQGATTIEIKSGYGLTLKDEVKILKVIKGLKKARIVPTYLGPHTLPPEFTNNVQYIDSILSDLSKIKKLTRRCDIFIEDMAFSASDSQRYFEKAKALGFDIVAHTNQLTASQGVLVAIAQGARSIDHVNFINEADIRSISNSSTTAVLTPGADLFLKNPYAPARRLLDSGARVAIASNFNPGSCPTQDLQMIGALARLELKMTYFEVLSAFTVNAGFALGLEDEVGSLQVGLSADFLTTNTSLTGIFYQPGSSPFTGIWRDGLQIS